MLKPLIPQQFTALALALGAALFGASQYLPAPYSLGAAALGSVSLFLGGLGWRAPAWAAGKPLLPATLVPLALAGHALVEQFTGALPIHLQPYALALGGLLALLGGILTPEPLKVVAPTAADNVAVLKSGETPVTTQVAATCSLADRARGLC